MNKTMCLMIDGDAKAFLRKTPSTMGYRPIYLCVIEKSLNSNIPTIKRLKKLFEWTNSIWEGGLGGVQFSEILDETNKNPKTYEQLYRLNLELEFIDFLRSHGFGVKQIPKI